MPISQNRGCNAAATRLNPAPIDDPQSAERCRSGRSGRSRKPLWVCAHRGFESHPLRHFAIKYLISLTVSSREYGGVAPCYSELLQFRGGMVVATPRLTRRGAIFYCRMAIPKRLIVRVGRAELIASLHTKDRLQAKLQYRTLSNAIDRLFEVLPHRQSAAAARSGDRPRRTCFPNSAIITNFQRGGAASPVFRKCRRDGARRPKVFTNTLQIYR